MKAKIKMAVTSMLAALTAFGATASRGKPAMAENQYQLPDLYGVMFEKQAGYTERAIGVSRVPLNGTDDPEVLADGMDQCKGQDLSFSGVYVDGNYYFTYCESGGWFNEYYEPAKEAGMYSCDMQTLQLTHTNYRVGNEENVNAKLCYSAMAYDYATDCVYADGYGENLRYRSFQKIRFTNGKPQKVENISGGAYINNLASAGVERMYNIGYSYNDKGLHLYRVNIETGGRSHIGKLGIPNGRVKGFCIDKANNRAIANILNDGRSYIYSIDLATAKSTCLYRLKGDIWFGDLFTMEDYPEASLPASCTVTSSPSPISIAQGEYTGTVTLTAPQKLLDKSMGLGPLKVKVLANSEVIGSTSCEWGEKISVDIDFRDKGAGWYNIRALATNEAGDGPSVNIANKIFIGYDTPKQPGDASLVYHDDILELFWTPTTEATNDGYILPENMTYTITDADGEIVAEGLTDCHWQTSVEIAKLQKGYQFGVSAVCDDVASTPAMTNKVSDRCEIPTFTPDLGASDGFKGWTVTDKKPDGHTWHTTPGLNMIDVTGPDDPKSGITLGCNADDLAATPPIKVRAGAKYRVKCHYTSHVGDPTIEVLIGDSPKPLRMTNLLFSHTSDEWEEYKGSMTGDVSEEFTADRDGYIYVGFNVKGCVVIFIISDISIEEILEPGVPAKGSIKAISDPDGELSAEVTFKFPTTANDGTELDAITQADLLRGSTVIKSIENPNPGDSFSYLDHPQSDGYARYSLVCHNNKGRGETATTDESIFVGFDSPTELKALTARPFGDGHLGLDWTPPTTDIHGHPYPAASLTFDIAMRSENEESNVMTGCADTCFFWQPLDEGQQKAVDIIVTPKYKDKEGKATVLKNIPVGTPYKYVETDFSLDDDPYVWVGDKDRSSRSGQSMGFWTRTDNHDLDINGADGYSGYVIFYNWIDDSARMVSGLIKTDVDTDTNTELSFYLYNYIYNSVHHLTPTLNIINVYVIDWDADEPEWKLLKSGSVNTLCGATGPTNAGKIGWYKQTVNLNDYSGHLFQFAIEAVGVNKDVSYLDNVRVGGALSGVEGVEEEVSDEVAVYAAEGCINILGADALEVTVCRADGSLLWQGRGTAEMKIPASSGIYIVHAGKHTCKLIVK